jgi:hypothetical protein
MHSDSPRKSPLQDGCSFEPCACARASKKLDIRGESYGAAIVKKESVKGAVRVVAP